MERNEKGHFLPGNKVASKSNGYTAIFKKDRMGLRKEIIKSALILTEEYINLEERLMDVNLTNMELLTAQAIQKKDYKFITWLVEMAIGKPHVAAEIKTAQVGLEHLILGQKEAEEEEEASE